MEVEEATTPSTMEVSSQVMAANERLEQAIDEHDALIESLFTRLGTVLLPEVNAVPEDRKTASDPRRSPLATDLDRQAAKVVEQNERLAALLRRLDV